MPSIFIKCTKLIILAELLMRIFLVCLVFCLLYFNHIQSYTNIGWNLMIKDEKITKKEILSNWNMFVGSQATNYGEDLTKRHDELWTSRSSFYCMKFSYGFNIWDCIEIRMNFEHEHMLLGQPQIIFIQSVFTRILCIWGLKLCKLGFGIVEVGFIGPK